MKNFPVFESKLHFTACKGGLSVNDRALHSCKGVLSADNGLYTGCKGVLSIDRGALQSL